MMNRNSRRHTNTDFSVSLNLILADVLMSGILGMIFLGLAPDRYDEGLCVTLAPYHVETQDTLKIWSSDILHLDIDSMSQVFIDSMPYSFLSVEKKVEEFVFQKYLTNRNCFIWIRVDRHANYTSYIQLRDIIMRAERTLLNDLSVRFYGEVHSDGIPASWLEELNRSVSICIIEEEEEGKPYIEIKPFCNY